MVAAILGSNFGLHLKTLLRFLEISIVYVLQKFFSRNLRLFSDQLRFPDFQWFSRKWKPYDLHIRMQNGQKSYICGMFLIIICPSISIFALLSRILNLKSQKTRKANFARTVRRFPTVLGQVKQNDFRGKSWSTID